MADSGAKDTRAIQVPVKRTKELTFETFELHPHKLLLQRKYLRDTPRNGCKGLQNESFQKKQVVKAQLAHHVVQPVLARTVLLPCTALG